MQQVSSIEPLRAALGAWRAAGLRVALVPTMGNVHAGHLALCRAALGRSDRVVASIFVNRMQFGPSEDFLSYPRTLEQDISKLAAVGVHLLFAPTEQTVYPRGDAAQTLVEVPELSGILCGRSRPGHFVGVATVVCKLFNMVQPDLAVFGEKDFQQLVIVRRMAEDLCLPVEIMGVPTVREADGLAMSSRNVYLTAEERRRAPELHRSLLGVVAAIRQGERDYRRLEQQARRQLQAAGLRPDYVSVRRVSDLGEPQQPPERLVVLAAAHLGGTRLIDNQQV